MVAINTNTVRTRGHHNDTLFARRAASVLAEGADSRARESGQHRSTSAWARFWDVLRDAFAAPSA